MIYDKKGLFILDYAAINNCKSYFDFIKKRILADYSDNQSIKANIDNILNSNDFIQELKTLYPRGILYDNVMWSFDDYEWVLFCLNKDEEYNNKLKKKKK